MLLEVEVIDRDVVGITMFMLSRTTGDWSSQLRSEVSEWDGDGNGYRLEHLLRGIKAYYDTVIL